MIATEDYRYRKIEQAIKFLAANFRDQPSLLDVAGESEVSPTHFQKLFSEWAGVSPKKFLQYLTVTELKKQLHRSGNLIQAAEEVGLSAQSRVYDLFVTYEAMTPQEYKTGGKGIVISFGVHDTPFGECLIAVTGRGVCAMQFLDGNYQEVLGELQTQWENAKWQEDPAATEKISAAIFSGSGKTDLKLFLRGTPFQLKVWEALLKIPFGSVTSYQHIATAIGTPLASRAVGNAVGANPIAYIIPCHRVIRQEAVIGHYRWGTVRKQALIGWEQAMKIG